MDLNPSEEQQQLIDTFTAFYTKECPIERVRGAEPSGHDADLWARLRAMGALDMAVDEQSGGWGGSLLDLALVAELHGRHLGPAPLIEGQVAVRLLARAGGSAATEALSRALTDGRFTTVALHPPSHGALALVPAGAIADEVVFFQGDRLMSLEIADQARPVSNLGSMPVADIAIDASAVELLSGPRTGLLFEQARDEWLALMANALVGIGSRSIELGVEYAKERHAFGVPIGSFQAVAHGLANAATAVDGGQLIAREAAWAADEDAARAPQLAAHSCGFCSDAAREASYRSLHYHGGYGFMLEFDIQLYFRRAKAWPALFGEPSAMYARGAAGRLSMSRTDG
ncbi:MAG TPA: acyl-CoA dehydrogenase family protein [Acidimicrobiales bacterium]|jgi:alkylation response protein AidB-like acyl-CoA dehydrogenase|nr:acyl-CoA dehydrogenase family protein [Acidimicrobiales bacterium]